MIKGPHGSKSPRMTLGIKDDFITKAFLEGFDRIVVGQQEAKKQIVDTLVNQLYSIVPKKGPIAVLFFYGPSGVGKTELAHALATLTMGRPDRLTKIKCEHLQEGHSLSNLIGSPKGYVGHDSNAHLSEKIYEPINTARKENQASNVINKFPNFNIIVLDEIEKAHPNIHQVLLGIMDDGQLNLPKGGALDFSESVIIMTSNIGARQKRDIDTKQSMGFIESDKIKDKEEVNREMFKLFSPEFLGRIDAKIEFQDLTIGDCKKIVNICLNRVNRVLEGFYNSDKGQFTKMNLQLSKSVYDYIVKKGFDKSKGARQLVRVFANDVTAVFSRVLHDNDDVMNYGNHSAKVIATMNRGKIKFILDKANVKKLPNIVPLLFKKK